MIWTVFVVCWLLWAAVVETERKKHMRRGPQLSVGSIEVVASCNDPRTWEVIQSVAAALGREVPFNSGWHIELPQAVLRLLDTQGEQAARSMVERCFAEKSSLAAAKYLGVRG